MAPVNSQPNAAAASKAPVNPATQRRPTRPRPPPTTQKPTITAIQILKPGVRPPTIIGRLAPRQPDGTNNQPTIATGHSMNQPPKVEACHGGMTTQQSPTPPTSRRTVQEAQRRPSTRTDSTAASRTSCTPPPSLVALAHGLTVNVPYYARYRSRRYKARIAGGQWLIRKQQATKGTISAIRADNAITSHTKGAAEAPNAAVAAAPTMSSRVVITNMFSSDSRIGSKWIDEANIDSTSARSRLVNA
ncbi:CREB-binding protein-like [Harpegnathos saltator]|uniref:CREB-binding protein-like n=1 Tax=Harpegnathos saltator TaxID=610380 RepID=UPI000DBECF24|nr:CREB-binding protein-like [Harpegnathos saltator]